MKSKKFSSDFKTVTKFLSRKDRYKLVGVLLIQFAFGLLDLIGVALLGVLGAIAVSGVESSQPGNRVSQVLTLLQLENMNLQKQATILALCAASLLIAKTLFSIYFIRKTLKFLSYKATGLSRFIISRMLSQPINVIQRTSEQQTLYGLTTGISAVTIGVIGNSISLVSDVSLLLVMSIGLVIIDPLMTLVLTILFGCIGVLLFLILNVRSVSINKLQTSRAIRTNQSIVEVLSTYRETVVRNRRGFYLREINSLKGSMAESTAELSFMPFISKYVIEISVVIGAVLISAIQFGSHDAKHAVATLSIFLAASTRIAPAVLRVQQGAISIRSNIAQSQPTIELLNAFSDKLEMSEISSPPVFVHSDFRADIKVSNLEFGYQNSQEKVLRNVSLEVKEGEVVALVGPSGSGKTTLVDLILGVLEPSDGQITISNYSPLEAFSRFQGAIAYVPQECTIIDGTIRDNIALGFDNPELYTSEIKMALNLAQLTEVVNSLPNGMDSYLGDKGVRFSGGQRQRLGIARALFTNPKLLVLDEATSSLDGETEEKITSSLYSLKGKLTILLIAHRLSTVKLADKVFYIENGHVVASGSFEDVRTQVPNFDYQANLMGL